MSTAERVQIERIKAERAKCATPIERIAFDNDPRNGPVGLRIIAMTEASAA